MLLFFVFVPGFPVQLATTVDHVVDEVWQDDNVHGESLERQIGYM